MRQGSFSAGRLTLDPLPRPELLEDKISAQAAEIERLVGDNRRLANAHVPLRDDLVIARQEAQRLNAHIRSIQTESDIQIKVLVDKISKMEAAIRASENVKKDLKQAHIEAQSLVKSRQEVTSQLQQSSLELQKVRDDVKSLPGLHDELDNLRSELKRLRATFEHEKSLNIEKVEQLQAMEQHLIVMAREVEKMRQEISNAEKGAHVPNFYGGGGYLSPDPSYLHTMHGGSGAYLDPYGRPQIETNNGPAVDELMPYKSGHP